MTEPSGTSDADVAATDDLAAARRAMAEALEPGLPLPEKAARLAAGQAGLAVLLEGEPSA